MNQLREKVRTLTPRTSGVSLAETIARLNQVLRGWLGYFQQAHRLVFPSVDGYVRGRLRSILRRRAGRVGRRFRSDPRQRPRPHRSATVGRLTPGQLT